VKRDPASVAAAGGAPPAPSASEGASSARPTINTAGGAAGASGALTMATLRTTVATGTVVGGGIDALLRVMRDVVLPAVLPRALAAPAGEAAPGEEGAAAGAAAAPIPAGADIGSLGGGSAELAWPQTVQTDFVAHAQRCVALRAGSGGAAPAARARWETGGSASSAFVRRGAVPCGYCGNGARVVLDCDLP
jgi:hypothetical protein